MPITPQDAAEALQLVSATERRSVELHGYQRMAPHLMFWSGIWALGYLADYAVPAHAGQIWHALVISGWISSYFMTRSQRRSPPDRRFFGILLTFVAFTTATIVIMAPHNPNQVSAFIPLVVAVTYIILGLFGLPRLMMTGIAFFVLTLVGYFALPGIFPLWMAAVGGGGLFLGGLWLRRA